jgi:hypothetical protein
MLRAVDPCACRSRPSETFWGRKTEQHPLTLAHQASTDEVQTTSPPMHQKTQILRHTNGQYVSVAGSHSMIPSTRMVRYASLAGSIQTGFARTCDAEAGRQTPDAAPANAGRGRLRIRLPGSGQTRRCGSVQHLTIHRSYITHNTVRAIHAVWCGLATATPRPKNLQT